MFDIKYIPAGDLLVAYSEVGPADGQPVILLHGFPYDIHAYKEVAQQLALAGKRCIVPYLRGYGATRFLHPDTSRSGQQAALGADLLALMDALGIPSAILAGYDWGGRAACIVAALWPERALGLVTGGGYAIQNIAGAIEPVPPELEHLYWYQYYFHSERGRRGLSNYRNDLCKLLWRSWSPHWDFDHATFARSAQAFDNPDFVEIVVHSYRHRFGLAAGDPKFEAMETLLARQPKIKVPTMVLRGGSDGVDPPEEADREASFFTGTYELRYLEGIGHNIPQEAPGDFASSVLAVG